MRELESLYEQGRLRLRAAVTDVPQAAATPVPACPEWSVHDVVAHVTGVCADILAGNLEGAATDAWTAAQVQSRRPLPTADVLAEWDGLGPKLAALVDDFPGWYGTQVVADITVHECDVLGALGRPPAESVPAATIERCLDFALCAVVDPGARALGLGPVELVAGDRSWTVGGSVDAGGDPDAAVGTALLTGRRPPPPDREPVVRVRTDPFELFRAVTGRRSADQVRRFDWSGDPAAWLPLFGLGPFTVPATDLAA